MTTSKFQQNFFRELEDHEFTRNLFDTLPEIFFFIKNKKAQFVKVNKSFLEKFGYKNESDVVGKTDYDMVPAYLADNYAVDDKKIFNSGLKIINKVELVTDKIGAVDWYITSKLPLYSTKSSIIGLVGVTRYFKEVGPNSHSRSGIGKIIDYIKKNYAANIYISELASMAGLSLNTFERKFRKQFHMTPLQYIRMVRISRVCSALIERKTTISQIALNNGFSDQSHLTRDFTKLIGTTPGEYRKSHIC